jgi:hypothetical protein
MVPFASFDRDSWRMPWPTGVNLLELPATLDDVPDRWWGTRTPEFWRAHVAGRRTIEIEPQAPAMFRSFCGARLGVRTSYKSLLDRPPVHVDPYPKDGLAISGYVPLEPIEVLDAGSAEGTALVEALTKEFDRVEQETVTKLERNAEWSHPISRDARRLGVVRLESWYRSPGAEPGWTVSYIEAVRQYAPSPKDKGCGLETLFTGWVHHHNGELKTPRELSAKITYCDRVGAMYMLPFGRIRPHERGYWVYQLSGWEDEWFVVSQIQTGKIRHMVHVSGGSRRPCS